MITIGNLEDTQNGVRCDHTTVLGNPFLMRDEADRDDVCFYFDRYFTLIMYEGDSPRDAARYVCGFHKNAVIPKSFRIPTREEFLAALDAIEDGSVILCWCHPSRCHLETVADYLNFKNKGREAIA